MSRQLTPFQNALERLRQQAPSRPLARLRGFGLWLVVLLQLAIPVSYYAWRNDPDDERFAWRMFSAVRLRRCEVTAEQTVAGVRQPLTLEHELHASWIGALQRGRRRVIDKFLERHCVHHPVDVVSIVRSCREVDGRAAPEQRFALDCAAHGARARQRDEQAPVMELP